MLPRRLILAIVNKVSKLVWLQKGRKAQFFFNKMCEMPFSRNQPHVKSLTDFHLKVDKLSIDIRNFSINIILLQQYFSKKEMVNHEKLVIW